VGPLTAVVDRPWHRARVYLRAVLPLAGEAVARTPSLARRLAPVRGLVQIEGPTPDLRATLRFDRGTLQVSDGGYPSAPLASGQAPGPLASGQAPHSPVDSGQASALVCGFRRVEMLNDFFAGKPVLPALRPWLGLRHPLLLAAAGAALLSLRVLEPQPAAVLAREGLAERDLRVRLLLSLVTASIGQLHADGFPAVTALSRASPDRVYQWTVGGTDIATFVRVRGGQLRAGRGVYGKRSPFVHFAFRDLDAAHAVLTNQGSQMTGFRGGLIVTHGSPEYARKMGLLMQLVDELLLEG
jgi:hypothetical protein